MLPLWVQITDPLAGSRLPSYMPTCLPIHSSTFLHTRLPSHISPYMPFYMLWSSYKFTCLPIHSPPFLYAHPPSYKLICLPPHSPASCTSPTFLYAHPLSYRLTCSAAFLYAPVPS